MRVIFKDRQQGKPIEGDIPAKYSRMADINYFKLGDGPLIKVRSIKKLIADYLIKKRRWKNSPKKKKYQPTRQKNLQSLFNIIIP